jgi:hypothetical protein
MSKSPVNRERRGGKGIGANDNELNEMGNQGSDKKVS